MELKDVASNIDKLISLLDVRLTDVQFLVELILCSKDDLASDKNLPKDIFLKELSNLLKYRYFKRLGTTIIKVQHNTSSTHKISRDLDLYLKPMVSAAGYLRQTDWSEITPGLINRFI